MSAQLIFPLNDGYLKEPFVPGKVYMLRSGCLMMYIGRDKTDDMVFYSLAQCALQNCDFNKVRIIHQAAQEKYLTELIQHILSAPWDASSFICYSTKPQIRMVWADFTNCFPALRVANRGLLESMGITCEPSNKNANSSFVKVKDLVPGAIYYTGSSPWRATYMYLGRDYENNFVYAFIGSPKDLIANPYNYISRGNTHVDRVKTAKKVRNYSFATPGETGYFAELCNLRLDITDALRNRFGLK